MIPAVMTTLGARLTGGGSFTARRLGVFRAAFGEATEIPGAGFVSLFTTAAAAPQRESPVTEVKQTQVDCAPDGVIDLGAINARLDAEIEAVLKHIRAYPGGEAAFRRVYANLESTEDLLLRAAERLLARVDHFSAPFDLGHGDDPLLDFAESLVTWACTLDPTAEACKRRAGALHASRLYTLRLLSRRDDPQP